MDYLIFKALAENLQSAWAGARIVRVTSSGPKSFSFQLLSGKNRRTLLFSLEGLMPRFHLLSEAPRGTEIAPPFLLLCRKFIEGARLKLCEVSPLQRVLVVTLETRDLIRGLVPYKLVFEVMGKQSSLVLANFDGKILGSVFIRADERLEAGRDYQVPVLSGERNVWTRDVERFSRVLRDRRGDLAKTLSSSFWGISRTHWDALLLSVSGFLSPEFLDESEIQALWREVSGLLDRPFPGAWLVPSETPGAWEITLLPMPGREGRVFPDIHTALEAWFSERDEAERVRRLRDSLLRALSRTSDRLNRKYEARKKEEERLFAAEALKGEAMELIASLSEIDPALLRETSARAQALFKQYKRARAVSGSVEARLASVLQEMKYVDSLRHFVGQGDDRTLLEDMEEELQERGYVPRPGGGARTRERKSSFRCYESKDGHRICVGRSNRENEALLHESTGPRDLWFHTRNMPGSHVILKLSGRERVPPELIELCARIAAHYSKGRGSLVEVDFTERKYVRKPRGSPPGFVLYHNARTVRVSSGDFSAHVTTV
ncbi:MAG: NFACT family protein [Armatimonadetes bacterium]|nr:NFACT family protein [Armatimonadota bacterium]